MRVLSAFCLILAGVTSAGADPAATAALNAFRSEQGRSPVALSRPLQRAAEAHAQDMARRGFFSHSGSSGSSVGDRVRAQGYGFCFVAENIAKGQKSLAQVMQSWAGSQGHRRNMADRRATEFALARAKGNVWVMVLAAPGC